MRVDQTIQQAEAIVRFAQEVDRRLAEFGIGGAAELIEIYHQMLDALARVEVAELERAAQETRRLQEHLERLGSALGEVSSLKAVFGVQH